MRRVIVGQAHKSEGDRTEEVIQMRCRIANAVLIAILALYSVVLAGDYSRANQDGSSGYTSLGDFSGSGAAYEFKDLKGFDQVQLTFSDMLASADNADLIMEMSKDAGATWERAHYNVGGTAVNPKGGTASLPSDVDAAAAHLYFAMDNTGGARNGGQLDFLSLQSSVGYKPLHGWCIGFYQADHQAWPGFIIGYLKLTAPISGIRLRYVDHNNNAKALTIMQGKASLAGIRK
jgi:hypothetical protein